jgi:plastocyanin
LKHGINVLIKSVVEEAGELKVSAVVDHKSVVMKMAEVKAKGMVHWVSCRTSVKHAVYFYGPLFDGDGKFNKENMEKVEMIFPVTPEDGHYEFERIGYFSFKEGVGHCLARLKK